MKEIRTEIAIKILNSIKAKIKKDKENGEFKCETVDMAWPAIITILKSLKCQKRNRTHLRRTTGRRPGRGLLYTINFWDENHMDLIFKDLYYGDPINDGCTYVLIDDEDPYWYDEYYDPEGLYADILDFVRM